jgi:Tub family
MSLKHAWLLVVIFVRSQSVRHEPRAHRSDTMSIPETKFLQTIMTAPSPKDYHKSTGLVHGVMKRHAGPFGRGRALGVRVYFSLQSVSGDETTYLVAEKDNVHSYTIASTLDQKIGSLRRIQANMTSVTYALYNHEGMQIATIVYAVPSVMSIVQDPPPRRAQVALRLANNLDVVTMNPMWFEIACQDSIRKKGNLDAVAVYTPLFVSKTPYAKAGGRVGLNFRGRGRFPSPKNMQLGQVLTRNENDESGSAMETAPLHNDTPIFVQMAKWGDDTYNVDYAAPFTALFAFAFGLAQSDL